MGTDLSYYKFCALVSELLAKVEKARMSALGHEQTLASELGMSDLPLKADIHQPGSHGWSGAEA